MASRADELELYVESDSHYGGVVDSTGKYVVPGSEFADMDQAQAIIRELESERDEAIRERVKAERERGDAKLTLEWMSQHSRRLTRERDEARRAYCDLHARKCKTPWWTDDNWRRKAADDAFGHGTGAELFPEEDES